MSMTREEIIKAYEDAVVESGLAAAAGNEEAAKSYELFKAGLFALRPVSREQVEKVWRGEWIGDNDEKVGTIDGSPIKSATCSACGNWLVGSNEYDCSGYFCPTCGSPMTDEAVEMVLERLEALHDNRTCPYESISHFEVQFETMEVLKDGY